MGFLDRFKKVVKSNKKDDDFQPPQNAEKVDNFSQLVGAISNGVKNIVLESDIDFSEEITLDYDDLTIYGQGHALDAGFNNRFFTINGRNIKFKSITFKNGFNDKDYGGMFAHAEKDIYYRGGAIYNNGSCCFFNCDFLKNSIGNKTWYERSRGNDHVNYLASGSAIYSPGDCFTYSCYYCGNGDRGEKSVSYGVSDDEEDACPNQPDYVSSVICYGVTVKEDNVESPNNDVIDNIIPAGKHEKKEKITKSKPSTERLNEYLDEKYDNKSHDLEEASDGQTIPKSTPDSQIRNFQYLNDLIHSGKKEIVLDCDIILDSEEHYRNGISCNDIVINGNGHTIDACGQSRIFYLSGKNNIIKSLTFKNGLNCDPGSWSTKVVDEFVSESYGGAIYNSGDCIFLDCNFVGNKVGNPSVHSSYNSTYVAKGAAIYNGPHSGRSYLYSYETCSEEIGNAYLYSCHFKDNEEIGNRDSKSIRGLDGDHYDLINCDMDIDCAYFLLKQVLQAHLDVTDNNIPDSSSNEESLHEKIRRSIEEGVKEINLEKDYVISGPVGLSADDLVINGNGHTIDACGETQLLYSHGNNVTLKNITLKNGYSEKSGGAIFNDGVLQLVNCRLENNISRFDGGAIDNNGYVMISGSEFSNNKTMGNIIKNDGILDIYGSNFKDNLSRHIISNHEGKNLYLFNCEFSDNCTVDAIIQNDGKSMTADGITFKNNSFKRDSAIGICNNGISDLKNHLICDGDIRILNNGKIRLQDTLKDAESHIENKGTITITVFDEDRFDFSYLDKKIHESDSKEILLEHDISFEDNEIDFYEGGIELDIDGLVIDGGGKSIDGRDLSRIFIVTARNITLKNITFKNGHSHESMFNRLNESGGALRINKGVNVSIENCSFINNISENNGGAIHQKGVLDIKNSSFCGNKSLKIGGAIYQKDEKLSVYGSTFNENTAEEGGAIYQKDEELSIEESAFEENIAEHGGAIYQKASPLSICNCDFTRNAALIGGAIDNRNGGLTIVGSKITSNAATECGGAVHVFSGGLTIEKSLLENNKAKKYPHLSTFAQKGGSFRLIESTWDLKFYRDLK